MGRCLGHEAVRDRGVAVVKSPTKPAAVAIDADDKRRWLDRLRAAFEAGQVFVPGDEFTVELIEAGQHEQAAGLTKVGKRGDG